MGPFQNTSPASAIFFAKAAAVCGPMSRPIQPWGMAADADHLSGRAFRELLRRDHVGGQQKLARRLFRLLQGLRSYSQALVVDLRRSDVRTLSLQEREAHGPADEQGVGQVEEPVDDLDLVGDLGAAQHHHERALGRGEQTVERDQFLLHLKARHAGQRPGQTGRGGMSPVRGAEGVVDDRGRRGAPVLSRASGRSSSPAGRSASSRAGGHHPGRSASTAASTPGPESSSTLRTGADKQLGQASWRQGPSADARRDRPWAGPGET